MTAPRRRSVPIMGTIVTIELVGTTQDATDDATAFERAFHWFAEVERVCNRFDPDSELRRLCARTGVPTPAGELLYSTLEFALAVAADTNGAFDPTVGGRMERRGFNRDYRTGEPVAPTGASDTVNFRDVHLDPHGRTVTLDRPLLLDLGAIAKGLAIDLAAKELAPFANYAIDAGGDLYLAGHNSAGHPWPVGIRHPRRDREAIEVLELSNAAVCTTGDYERIAPGGTNEHHIVDPRSGDSAGALASATVVAPTAMLADALSTAAFVLGPAAALDLLGRHGVEGVLFSPTLMRFSTSGLPGEAGRG